MAHPVSQSMGVISPSRNILGCEKKNVILLLAGRANNDWFSDIVICCYSNLLTFATLWCLTGEHKSFLNIFEVAWKVEIFRKLPFELFQLDKTFIYCL